MFEHRSAPLLPRTRFALRVARSLLLAALVLAAALAPGIVGYRWLLGVGWLDALLDASMILSSMGPVDLPHTPAGKVFASLYALSGLVFVSVAAIVVTPVAHRLLHRFHLEEQR
jgi:hypothetical protein